MSRRRQERHEEWVFVLEHGSALAKISAEILHKRDSEKYRTTYKMYFDAITTAKVGKRLPSWCHDTSRK